MEKRAVNRKVKKSIAIIGEGLTEYPGPSSKEYADYDAVAQELKRHIPNYDKTETFFNKTHIYRVLKEKGDITQAIEISRELEALRAKEPEVYRSYSQMYKLFDVIEGIMG